MKSVTLRSFIRLIQYGLLSLLIVVVVVACGGDEPAAPASTANTPAAGGMVIPTATSAPTTVATATPAPGQQLWALGVVRLYADAAPDAIVMNQYGVDSVFTLLEPSGLDAAYPVTVDGEPWYRVRAADGLVGWAPTAQLAMNR